MKTSIRTHEGRVALVTGAGQGIGQAIALALAERGAQVIATDLKPPQETARKIGRTACAFQLDVTQEEDWRSVFGKSRDVGDVDIVVNNAGYFPNRSIYDLDLPTWRKTIATNLDSHFLSAKYFLPTMRKKGWGRFVGISSNMVGLAIPGMCHYIASKMGIIGFMRGFASRFCPCGVHCRESVEIVPRALRFSLSENRNDIYAQAPAVVYIGDLLGSVYFSCPSFSRPDFHKTIGVNLIAEHLAHGHR